MRLKTDLNSHVPAIYGVGTDEEGPIKIGFTKQLPERMGYLNNGSPYPLQVFFVRFIPARPTPTSSSLLNCFDRGARQLERRIHAKLDEFELRLQGEWFDVSAQDALAVVEKVTDMHGLRCIGVGELSAVDLSSQIDLEMKAVHRLLLHDALALNTWVQHNNSLASASRAC